MLMTKYSYTVDLVDTVVTIVVTRLKDNKVKTFTLAGKSPECVPRIKWFMDSITDDLAESYFPKPRKD